MPTRPAPPLRGLAAGALLSLALAGALLAPGWLQCHVGEGGCGDGGDPGALRAWLGIAFMLWSLGLGAVLTRRWLPRAPRARRIGLAVQIAALALASLVMLAQLGLVEGGLHVSPYALQMQLTFAACACLAVEFHASARRGEAAAESLHRDEAALAGRLDAARAALLQAQVEPHFLFNTLAHLRRLARTDATAARAMLADLRRYLAAALPELRQSEAPLARELELVHAFLALHQRRIGPERLRLVFDIAPGLDDFVLPSTCLLTLAENAIKHGIAPQVDGGEICVRALPDPDDAGLLRLEVADTGAGMGASSGGGTGLATLRARLAAACGPAARLSLHLNQPRGLIARVQLPWH